MTEEDACVLFATAWNRLNPDVLIDALDEDINYSSQTVLTNMEGKDEVANYLRAKMATIRSAPTFKIYAELAKTQPYPMYPVDSRPCVIVSQSESNNLVATVLFETSLTGIRKIEMCIIPPPETTIRSGKFPA